DGNLTVPLVHADADHRRGIVLSQRPAEPDRNPVDQESVDYAGNVCQLGFSAQARVAPNRSGLARRCGLAAPGPHADLAKSDAHLAQNHRLGSQVAQWLGGLIRAQTVWRASYG